MTKRTQKKSKNTHKSTSHKKISKKDLTKVSGGGFTYNSGSPNTKYDGSTSGSGGSI
jgi:hypothetical protein